MTELVDPNEIEEIFGQPRRKEQHLYLERDGIVYIMHSQDCVDTGIDLRECTYSKALDLLPNTDVNPELLEEPNDQS